MTYEEKLTEQIEYARSRGSHLTTGLLEAKRLYQECTPERLLSWAFRRPYCQPASGIVMAYSMDEARSLVEAAYGHCSDLYLYCPATGEENTI